MKKLKTLFLTLFLMGFVLPAMSQNASECDELLKMVANELNSQCPMNLEGGIKMTSCTYSGKVLSMNIDMKIIDAKTYNEASSEFKDSFFEGLFGTDGGEYIYDWLNNAGAKISMKFTLKDGVTKTMIITPADIRRYLQDY